MQRRRHGGHPDAEDSYEDRLAGIQLLARLGPLGLEPRIDVDTSVLWNLEDVVRDIRGAFEMPDFRIDTDADAPGA